MEQNKHGPNTGFGATRGDPGISGNCKRGRAPCPSAQIPFPLARMDGVADGLFASGLTRRRSPEWEGYAIMSKQLSMFNDQLSMRYIDVYQLIEHCALKHCTLKI